MIEPTNEPVAATGDQGEPTEGNLLKTAREAGTVAQERLGGLRDAAQSTLEDAKSAATEKAGDAKHQAADEIARTAGASRWPPKRWMARRCNRICSAKPRMV